MQTSVGFFTGERFKDAGGDILQATVADADVDLTESNISTVGTGGIVLSLIAAHAAATVQNIGYTGGKRYLKVLSCILEI